MPLHNFRQIHMPYCLKRNVDGTYVVLNREYKPLGFDTKDYISYEDYPIAIKYKISKVTAKKLAYNHEESNHTIYLYNDGCIPEHSAKNMKAYIDKLTILAKITKIEQD